MEESVLWKTIWSLPIPNAVKIFFWRACHNLLRAKDNLLRGKVVKDPFCPICEREPETVLHAIWVCPAAMDVWGSCKRAFQKCVIESKDFIHVAEYMMSRCGNEDFALFVQVARQIWFRRNK